VADLKRSCQFYSNLGFLHLPVDGKIALIDCVEALISIVKVDQLAGEGLAGKCDRTIPSTVF